MLFWQVTIVIKYFFQFGFFPFNQKLDVDRSKPFHPPNILGVEKKEGYVLYDLLQLLALFYHRATLKVRQRRASVFAKLTVNCIMSQPTCLVYCSGSQLFSVMGPLPPPPSSFDPHPCEFLNRTKLTSLTEKQKEALCRPYILKKRRYKKNVSFCPSF